jgi:MoxR-like ATPase
VNRDQGPPIPALVDAPDVAARLELALGRVLVGQPGAVRGVLVALIGGGHVLLEGPPGLGKTLLVRTLADLLALEFRRIPFTPDLMPADILGTQVLSARGAFEFWPGPVFANLVLADEINRATPRTQSALLEAMQEHTVTVAGRSRPLPAPFFVLATESAADGEGLYALPEAQLDRFLVQLRLRLPGQDALRTIAGMTARFPAPGGPNPPGPPSLRRKGGAGPASHRASSPFPQWEGGAGGRSGLPARLWGEGVRPILDGAGLLALQRYAASLPVASYVRDYAVRLALATRPDQPSAPALVRRYVRYGASPRALQALEAAARAHALLEGRFNVAFGDVRRVAPAVLRHRLRLNVEADVRAMDAEQVVAAVLAAVPEERRRGLGRGGQAAWSTLPRLVGRWRGRPA